MRDALRPVSPTTAHALTRAEGGGRAASRYRLAFLAAIVVGLGAMILASVPSIAASHRSTLWAALWLAWAAMSVDWALRVYAEPAAHGPDDGAPGRARLRYLRTLQGAIDTLGVVAWPALALTGPEGADDAVAALVWVFKAPRYSHGFALLRRVVRHSASSLLSVLAAFLTVLITAATLAHLFERQAQPEAFGSIPAAMWWAIVTLTTTGYGDAVPATVWGRLLAGWTMVGGIAVFALWAGILAGSFGEELKRRDFLRSWDLVARVPFLSHVGAGAISEVARMLRPRELQAGAILFRRGDAGDAMYFIVEGRIALDLQPKPVDLNAGDFVGEIALITGAPRGATARAVEPTQLLALDIADFRDLAARLPVLTDAIQAEGGRRLEQNRQAQP